jgi:fructoselysine 6-kinase
MTWISYDLATVYDFERIATVAPHCFLVALSASGTSSKEALALAQLARSAGARWSLVTRGIEGALLVGEAGIFEVPAKPVDAVDTLGAGDTYIANVLVGLLNDLQPEAILEKAAEAAAQTCLMCGAFGHKATMTVDLSGMMSLEEIYGTTRPANASK